MTCEKCNGSHRIPWPEAGMMQDCPCVVLGVPIREAAPLARDRWALPAGLKWWDSTAEAGSPSPTFKRWLVYRSLVVSAAELRDGLGLTGCLLRHSPEVGPLILQRNAEEP